MGGIDLFVNLCHLLCGVPHGGWRGLGWRGNVFLSAGFGGWSPDRADRAPARGGAVARPGRQPGVCKDCIPIAQACPLSAGGNIPQLLAKFYRKLVAVFGRCDAQVALRSCCSTNKTYRPTFYPIVFMGTTSI
jgi:hypothetical protein